MAYDTSKLIGPVIGAAGAAIGIGLLAGTAKRISDMNKPRRKKPVKHKRKQQRKRTYKYKNYWGYRY